MYPLAAKKEYILYNPYPHQPNKKVHILKSVFSYYPEKDTYSFCSGLNPPVIHNLWI